MLPLTRNRSAAGPARQLGKGSWSDEWLIANSFSSNDVVKCCRKLCQGKSAEFAKFSCERFQKSRVAAKLISMSGKAYLPAPKIGQFIAWHSHSWLCSGRFVSSSIRPSISWFSMGLPRLFRLPRRPAAFARCPTAPHAALFHKERAIALGDVLGAPKAQPRGGAIDLPAGSLQLQEQRRSASRRPRPSDSLSRAAGRWCGTSRNGNRAANPDLL